MKFTLMIPGTPRTKKNSPSLFTQEYRDVLTGETRLRTGMTQSKAYKAWFKNAMTYALLIKSQLREQGAELPIKGRLRVTALCYLEDERWVGDLNGYCQAIGDFLQEPKYDRNRKVRQDGAGIIVDDKQISSWGESTRDLRDKVNPRIEVTIEVLG